MSLLAFKLCYLTIGHWNTSWAVSSETNHLKKIENICSIWESEGMLFLSLFAVLIELFEKMEKIDNKVSDHSIKMNSGNRFDRDI